MTIRTQSLWHATHQIRRFGPLTRELTVDVAVIGGGISGLTAAVLLARAGRSVALLEREHLGNGETGLTTSHLTDAVDARYQTIRRDFGDAAAGLVARSSRDAIDRIEQFVAELAIECGFERVPGYLYSEREEDVAGLASELDAAGRAGCAVEWTDAVPLPFATAGGICWHNQAQVHALAYLASLVEEAVARGVRIFDETPATGVDETGAADHPCLVRTSRFAIHATDVFVAASVPVNNGVLLPTKLTAYRSYAMALDLGASEAGRSDDLPTQVTAGLFWDTDSPYHYTRSQEVAGRRYLIVGGEDHQTADDPDTDRHFGALAAYAAGHFGAQAIRYRWSGQIIESVDGLPFIGLNSGSSHVYVATGYSGNGMTFGTLAGMLVTDLMLGRENPYAALYDATRIKPIAAGVSAAG